MRRMIILVAVVAAMLVVGSGVAVAVATKLSGGTINQVRVARDSSATTTTSQSPVDVPGASVRISVPSGQKGLILARFSAESACYNTDGIANTGEWCTVNILAVKDGTGTVTYLGPGDDFAFDAAEASNEEWEAHAIDRSVVLGPGTYTVKVQYETSYSSSYETAFRLDDWHLTVEKAKIS